MKYEDPDREKHLDAILDAALALYHRDAEPRTGLEDRILANLRTQPLAQRPRWLAWPWMTAAAVPHQEVFPSPAPLSQQERLLLSYVKLTPEKVLIAVSEEQQLHEQQWMQEIEQMQKSQQKSEHLK